jgi:uncharacterized protein
VRAGKTPPVNGRAVGRRRLIGLTGALVVVLAAWNNLVVTRLPGHPGSYVAANLAAACAVLAAARSAGLGWEELGLAQRRLPAGLVWGGVCFALVAVGYATAVTVPALRPLLTDARVRGMDGAELAYQVFVRIPFGTVLWEEMAFRGVLLAALARLLPLPAATAASSALFGFWHIRPTLDALASNDLLDGPVPTGAAVLLACLWTAAAGALFTWLRRGSGSLLAPALLHLATNSLGTLAAALALRIDGCVSRPRRGARADAQPSRRSSRVVGGHGPRRRRTGSCRRAHARPGRWWRTGGRPSPARR